jgi:hypothetical protein
MHLGDLLWTTLVIFFMVIFFMMLFRVIIDIFRSDDLSGWAKAAWFIGLFFFSLLTLLIYVIVRGKGMAERDMAQVTALQKQQEQYIRQVATDSGSGGGSADQIEKAHALLEKGAISQDEFDKIKAKALA